MAAAHRGIILLTGAPNVENLTWDERDLLSDFNGRSKRYLHPEAPPTDTALLPTPSGAHRAQWRWIALDSLVYEDPTAPNNELRPPHLLTNGDAADDDFLEHSIAILENLDSSQIISTNLPSNNASDLQTTTFISFLSTNISETSTSFNATITSPPSNSPPITTTTSGIKLPGQITDLKRLPPAAEITRLLPQTITVNLLVALITLTPTRSVPVRRPRNHSKATSMDILELIVGDESRAGFRITFWLHSEPPATEEPGEDEDAPLRQTLLRLRPGNLLLLTNVALSSWRGNVYGQNLGRRFARGNSTVLSLLSDVESPQVGGRMSLAVGEKWRRLREWSAEFVGGVVVRGEDGGGEGRGKGKGRERLLPPDTQD